MASSSIVSDERQSLYMQLLSYMKQDQTGSYMVVNGRVALKTHVKIA